MILVFSIVFHMYKMLKTFGSDCLVPSVFQHNYIWQLWNMCLLYTSVFDFY
jgi:hypothetical protein